MTIVPTAEQEQILAEAIQAGLVRTAEDALDIGLETLRSELASQRVKETPEEWVQQWDSFVNSHSPDTPVLSDEAMSRESIYEGRGL